MRPTVRVVVVSYETREELRRCLRALTARTRPGLEVVVVDNASGDGSAAMVRDEFPAVRLDASPSNLGFAGGVNRGLRGCTSDYVLVLNPDVELDPGVLDALVGFLEEKRDAAAVSPLLVGDDGRPQEHLYRRFPSALQVLLFWTLLARVAGRVRWLRKRYLEHRIGGRVPVAVDQLPGAALLMRRSDLEDVGRWDPGYFIWWEDVDWCYRARRAGRALYALPDTRARHGGGASFDAWTAQTQVLQFYRAFYRFLAKHGLDALLRRSHRILSADLAVKTALVRWWARLGRPVPERLRPEVFTATRAEIRRLARLQRSGVVPDFTAGDVRADGPGSDRDP